MAVMLQGLSVRELAWERIGRGLLKGLSGQTCPPFLMVALLFSDVHNTDFLVTGWHTTHRVFHTTDGGRRHFCSQVVLAPTPAIHPALDVSALACPADQRVACLLHRGQWARLNSPRRVEGRPHPRTAWWGAPPPHRSVGRSHSRTA